MPFAPGRPKIRRRQGRNESKQISEQKHYYKGKSEVFRATARDNEREKTIDWPKKTKGATSDQHFNHRLPPVRLTYIEK
jgi:hypothetical protein